MNTTRLALIAKAVNNVQNKKSSFINKSELKSIIDNEYTNVKNNSVVKINELDFN